MDDAKKDKEEEHCDVALSANISAPLQLDGEGIPCDKSWFPIQTSTCPNWHITKNHLRPPTGWHNDSITKCACLSPAEKLKEYPANLT